MKIPVNLWRQTRREGLKSALYLRLKKRKVLKICPACLYEKRRKQFQKTQRVLFMLDHTRKPLFPKWKQKMKTFFEKKWIFSLGI